MGGLVKRRLYKRERAPARTKGVLYDCAPVRLPGASMTEVKTAIFAACSEGGFIIGRGVNYDPLKDIYTVIGKSKATGKAQDVTIEGYVVADLIRITRKMFGGKFTSARADVLEVSMRLSL